MARRLLLVCVVALAAALAVGTWLATRAGGSAIEGFGLSADLPDGWVGRVAHPPRYGITLEASTLPLRAPAAPICDVDPGPDDVLVLVTALERPQRADSRTTPLRIGRADLRGPFTCGFLGGVLRGQSIEGRALSIRALFGSRRPRKERIAEVNSILASLEVRPAS